MDIVVWRESETTRCSSPYKQLTHLRFDSSVCVYVCMIEFISHNHIRTHMLTYLLRTIDRVFVSFMVCQSIQDESTNYVYLCTTQYPHVRQIQHGERFVNKTGGRLYILAFA